MLMCPNSVDDIATSVIEIKCRVHQESQLTLHLHCKPDLVHGKTRPVDLTNPVFKIKFAINTTVPIE